MVDEIDPNDVVVSRRFYKKEDRIVLINIGLLDRRGIANQLTRIARYQPALIGIDVFFNCPEQRDTINCPNLLDTLGNQLLADAIKEAGNVVMVSKVLQK